MLDALEGWACPGRLAPQLWVSLRRSPGLVLWIGGRWHGAGGAVHLCSWATQTWVWLRAAPGSSSEPEARDPSLWCGDPRACCPPQLAKVRFTKADYGGLHARDPGSCPSCLAVCHPCPLQPCGPQGPAAPCQWSWSLTTLSQPHHWHPVSGCIVLASQPCSAGTQHVLGRQQVPCRASGWGLGRVTGPRACCLQASSPGLGSTPGLCPTPC